MAIVKRREFFAVNRDGKRVHPNSTLVDQWGQTWEYLGLVDDNMKIYAKHGTDPSLRRIFYPQVFGLHIEVEEVETNVTRRSEDRRSRLEKEYDQ